MAERMTRRKKKKLLQMIQVTTTVRQIEMTVETKWNEIHRMKKARRE
jgi:hypothetical protein